MKRSRSVLTGLIGMTLALGAVLSPSQAGAFSFRFSYSGPVTIKVNDYTDSSLYPNGTSCTGAAACDATPHTTPLNGIGGEDSWAIFKISSILTAAARPGHPIGETLWGDGDAGEQLTGILYGIQDIKVTIAADGSTGTIDSAGVPGGVGLDSGVNIKVYLDSATPYDPSGGPLARCGQGCYPTVTDGSLFLSAAFVPGITGPLDDPTALLRGILTSNAPFVTTDQGFANVNGGAFASTFDTNGFTTNQGTIADISVKISAQAMDTPGGQTSPDVCGVPAGTTCWTTASDDPIRANVIPQPLPLTLLGLSLGLVAGLRRLRKLV